MKHYIQSGLLLLLLLGSTSCTAGRNSQVIPKNHDHSSQEVPSGKEMAAEILDRINEMRGDPAGFYKKYIRNYIRDNPQRFTSYYTHSLERTMKSLSSLPQFTVHPNLVATATYQAKYLKQFKGKRLEHDAPGLSFEQRLRKEGIGCGAENLYTGENRTALEVVIDLLIDQHVRSLGHRKNLLNPSYQSIGISVESFSGKGAVIVMDFGCK